MSPHPLWQTLEDLPALAATTSVWQARLRDRFEVIARNFLERCPDRANSIPCPRGCGCAHEVIRDKDNSFVAVCRCDPWNCDDIELSEDEVVLWKVNLEKFARAVGRAFGIQSRVTRLSPSQTFQVGTWSTEAIPIILTISSTEEELQLAAASLSASLRERFILLVPTLRHVGVGTRQALSAARAGLFALDAVLALTASGFEPLQAPGKIFHEFTPVPSNDPPEEVAKRAFALVQKLDSGRQKPSLVTIFRLYCLENLSSGEIAEQLGVSRATVVRRLQTIRTRTGLDPRRLRVYSSHLDKIRESLDDSRARRVNLRATMDDSEAD
jgi:hypothetical protein